MEEKIINTFNGISFMITVANEEDEFFKLLNHLSPFLRINDEIIVKLDESKTTPNIKQNLHKEDFLTKYQINHVIFRSFTGNFAEWKNEMIDYAENDVLFFIDADELPNPTLIEMLPSIIEFNDVVDVFRVPRINYVEGITDDYVRKMGWNKDSNNRINWNSGDYQTRIMRNKRDIQWVGQVHEILKTNGLTADLPKIDECALLHVKTFEKQVLQNMRYVSQDYSK